MTHDATHAAAIAEIAAGHPSPRTPEDCAEAEIGLRRHIARNANQMLYSFLDLIEAKPGEAAATASEIRKQMEEYERQEAANIRGGRIIAAAQPPPPGFRPPSDRPLRAGRPYRRIAVSPSRNVIAAAQASQR